MMEVDDETSANLVSKRRDFAFINRRRDSRRGTSNTDTGSLNIAGALRLTAGDRARLSIRG